VGTAISGADADVTSAVSAAATDGDGVEEAIVEANEDASIYGIMVQLVKHASLSPNICAYISGITIGLLFKVKSAMTRAASRRCISGSNE
jgi:hypothetical protein